MAGCRVALVAAGRALTVPSAIGHAWSRPLSSRRGAGFSGGQLSRPGSGPGGGTGGSELHRLFALPHYKIARKTEDDLAAALDSEQSESVNGGRFPFKDDFEIQRGVSISGAQVVESLAPLMTQDRIDRIAQVCASRSFNVLPIVEHAYDMGNLAAVCRSADALGFGAVHVVRNPADTKYKQSKRSSAGADKWLDVQVWDSTRECLQHVKKLGYQVVVTHLSPDAVDISQIDWTRPTAFVMGNEERGVSEEAVAMADACAVVPMVGFVDSFNISVAAALVMYEARRCREQRLGAHGDLTEREQELLRAVFFLRNKGQTQAYIRNMLSRPPPHWQSFRGGGDWGGKSFSLDTGGGSVDEGGSSEGGASSTAGAAAAAGAGAAGGAGVGQQLPVLRQRVHNTQCHYWDGQCCWGERFLWPGKPCRYIGSHSPGVSIFNKEKLKQMCERMGREFPDLASPPPMPPLSPAIQAAADAATAQAAAAAAAEYAVEEAEAERGREVHEALLATAAAAAAADDGGANGSEEHAAAAADDGGANGSEEHAAAAAAAAAVAP